MSSISKYYQCTNDPNLVSFVHLNTLIIAHVRRRTRIAVHLLVTKLTLVNKED